MLHAQKPVLVQAFITKATVEALDVGVLHGFPWPDEGKAHRALVGPSIEHLALKFRTVIDRDRARQAAHLGFAVTVLSDACAAMAVKGPEGAVIAADQVHRTHLGSLQGFLADITPVSDL